MTLLRCFSLIISAPRELEVPYIACVDSGIPDVVISLEACPKGLLKTSLEESPIHVLKSEYQNTMKYQKTADQCRIEIEEVGLFEIPNPQTIYATFYNASNSAAVYSFWANVIPALLTLRGHFVFHANTIVIEGAAYLFAGQSGAGKSTFTTYLHQNGCHLLSDDITVVYTCEDQLYAIPGKREVRLLEESQNSLRLERADSYRQVQKQGATKFCYFLGAQNEVAAYPIKALFLIKNESEAVALTSLSGVEKFDVLIQSLFSLSHPHLEFNPKKQFQAIMKIADVMPMLTLERPNSFSSLSLMHEAVLNYHKEAVIHV